MSLAEASILMAVYLGDDADYLRVALKSLVGQTILANEVVLVADGPLSSALDQAIDEFHSLLPLKVIRLDRNRGLAYALNQGLGAVKNELVIRMDADDISVAGRVEKLVSHMVSHPDLAACSSAIREFGGDGRTLGVRRLPRTHEELVRFAKMRSPLNHAAAIFRRSAVLKVGGYPLFRRSQDVALWSRLIVAGYKLGNIDDVLYLVRGGDGMARRRGFSHFLDERRVLKFQRDLNFISLFQYLRNVALRFFVAVFSRWFIARRYQVAALLDRIR